MKGLQIAAGIDHRVYDDTDEPPPLELELESSRDAREDNQIEHKEDASLMDEMVAVAQRAKEQTRRRQEKERNSRAFGQGLKKGFFNAKPRTREGGAGTAATTLTPKAASAAHKKLPTREDLLIVKQNDKGDDANATPSSSSSSSDSRFVFPEVQSALKSVNQLDPKDAKLIEKLAKNPRLVLALQNPRFTQAIDEMQREPEAAIRKYRNDPAVSAMLQDFLGFMGSHFEELGKEQEAAASKQRIVDLDETRRAAIAGMERSPEEDAQVQKILQSPELLQALSDADLMARLQRCRESPQELLRLQSDPSLRHKLRLLADAGLVRFE
ncbi:hypothetical protein PybrP1_008347 [[Pythium] brassicae (nom. inval.)]|nr:hypothetical protein PybrP1_008347 [[Pythium] brassicae (nom. inval.)]